MQKHPPRHASWRDLLAAPAPASHIVQLCESDDFLAAGVAHFAAEGLTRGEAVLLTGTQDHLRGIHRALAALGVDAPSALREGRLVVTDAAETIAGSMVDGACDPARFESAAVNRLVADAGKRFAGLRWWGEMTNLLCAQGNRQAGLRAEELADAAAKRHGITIFCSFECDRFCRESYGGILREICALHSHVIPTEDYVGYRLAVNRAVSEVIGEIRGPLLQSLLSWRGLACELPSSQALLFWIGDTMPERFGEVLARAKAYHGANG